MTTSFQVFTTIKLTHSGRNFVLKLVDNFLLSCSASLIITPTRLISSITLRNLNRFQKNLVRWNQHEKFCLLVKFERNQRWWVDLLGHLTWNDPYCIYLCIKSTNFG